MASDTQILKAAREVSLELAAFNTAKEEQLKTARANEIAVATMNAAQIRHANAERLLLELSRQKGPPVPTTTAISAPVQARDGKAVTSPPGKRQVIEIEGKRHVAEAAVPIKNGIG